MKLIYKTRQTIPYAHQLFFNFNPVIKDGEGKLIYIYQEKRRKKTSSNKKYISHFKEEVK